MAIDAHNTPASEQARRIMPLVSGLGACFMLSDDEAPDTSRQWFFCSEPSTDANMRCELISEGHGGRSVWLCSTPKDEP